MTDHYRAAREYLVQVETAIARLQREHAQPLPNKRAVASLYDEIGQGVQLAKIHAQLATAQQLADLAVPR